MSRSKLLLTMDKPDYIHGTHPKEQARLELMNGVINAAAVKEMNILEGARILDVGCGLAQLTFDMANAVGPKGHVIGIERSEQQLETARRGMDAQLADHVELRRGDAYDLPLATEEWGSFDIVHTRFMLEHLTEPQRAVNAMAQAARPGGRIILQDDDHDVMRFWPPVPCLEQVWHEYARSYEHLGCDGYIGRKLPELLSRAGARPTRSTWLFYGGCAGDPLFRPLTENLVGVLDGARDTILIGSGMTNAIIDEALQEFRSWCDLDHAALWYAICWAEGTF